MDTIDERKAIIQPIAKGWYSQPVAVLDMLRLDLLHPVISGNKWFKLRLNIRHAIDGGFKTIVTFGGGFSNHLIATAYAAKMFGIKSIGIVRGRYDVLTPTLAGCKDAGMQLIFASKEEYERKEDMNWIREMATHFDELFIIPEGGANEWGRAGAGLIDRFISHDYTHLALSVGTGTTLAGLRNKLDARQQLLGFVPMKQGAYLQSHIAEHLQANKNTNWQLFDDWHFGGFGKWNDELLQFMNDFHQTTNIPLDIVYTSKMMYGIRELLTAGFFAPDARILCIHTGGLQGNVSVKDKLSF